MKLINCIRKTRTSFRVIGSIRSLSTPQEYLLSKGYSKDTAHAMLNEMAQSGMSVSVSTLESFGASGLKSLAESVEEAAKREKEAKEASVNVVVHVPSENLTLNVKARSGETLLDASYRNKDFGAHLEWSCGGNAACSTCHVFVNEKHLSLLEPPDDSELDMLDMAWGVSDNSRLACQIIIPDDCDSLEITIPEESNDFYS